MHLVCCCSLLVWRRSFLLKGTPVTYFGPALDPPLGGSGRKTTTLLRDHEFFSPTKFHQNPSSGSGEEVEMWKVYGRRTTDGRCALTIAHSSLRLWWAKNLVLTRKKIILLDTQLDLIDLFTSLFECYTPAKPLREVLLSLFYGRIAMLFQSPSLYLYVGVYVWGCVIWTWCQVLDFHKLSIVSCLRNHDYINDSHVPNSEVEDNKLPLKFSSSDHITWLGIKPRSLVL